MKVYKLTKIGTDLPAEIMREFTGAWMWQDPTELLWYRTSSDRKGLYVSVDGYQWRRIIPGKKYSLPEGRKAAYMKIYRYHTGDKRGKAT